MRDKSQLELLEEELQLLRSGKPFHTHRYFVSPLGFEHDGQHGGDEVLVRCSSPYCNSLTEPPQEGPRA